MSRSQLTHTELQAAVASARVAPGEEAWAAAFPAGRGLSLEEAIAETLGDARPPPIQSGDVNGDGT